jgi:hypothetical protein
MHVHTVLRFVYVGIIMTRFLNACCVVRPCCQRDASATCLPFLYVTYIHTCVRIRILHMHTNVYKHVRVSFNTLQAHIIILYVYVHVNTIYIYKNGQCNYIVPDIYIYIYIYVYVYTHKTYKDPHRPSLHFREWYFC